MNRRLLAEGLPLCVIPWPEVRSPLKSEKMGVWPGLKADARIGTQFRDTNPAQLAGSLTDQLCQLAGGPCTYKGPDMKTAHADMGITRADFNALVEVLQASMNAKGIPFARQNQMLALLAPMHRDVIAPRP